MKKIFTAAVMSLPGIFLCAGCALAQNAASPENTADAHTCTKLLGSAIRSQLLESVCGFNGGVFQQTMQSYNDQGCPSVIPPGTVNDMSKAALADTQEQLTKAGSKDAFCKANANAYNALK